MKEKVLALKSLFAKTTSPEERYQVIIQLGQATPPLSPEHCTQENRVDGCQSTLYLHTKTEKNKLYFEAQSDALISNGLAALLTRVYSGESPETILKEPPTYLEELQIPSSLSPTRANGLASLHLRMKREALSQVIHGV